MITVSKNEFFELIPDRGNSLMMYLGTQTSQEVIEDFFANDENYTCERYVYVELTFKDGSQKICCLKLVYSRSTAARALEAKEILNLEEVDFALDLKPIEAIIFDNMDEQQLHLKTHGVRARNKPVNLN